MEFTREKIAEIKAEEEQMIDNWLENDLAQVELEQTDDFKEDIVDAFYYIIDGAHRSLTDHTQCAPSVVSPATQ